MRHFFLVTAQNSPALSVFSAIVLAASLAAGHEDDDAAGGAEGDAVNNRVVIKTQGDKRIIEANGLPDHKPGEFPNRGNPNSISEQHYQFEMPLKPHANDEPKPVQRFIFGVAVNGVVFDPGTAEVWRPGDRIENHPGRETRRSPDDDPRRLRNYEGMGTMKFGIDAHHAHVQPNGAYHYHGLPTGLIARLRKEHGDKRMLLIAYAADGFPMYAEFGHEKAADADSALKKLHPSYQLKKGSRPSGNDGPGGRYDGTFVQDFEFVKSSGDLDECNGRVGVTPEYPDGTFYYVATDAFPFIPRFFRGTPDSSFERQGPPPGPPGSPRRGGFRPPTRGPYRGEGPPPPRPE